MGWDRARAGFVVALLVVGAAGCGGSSRGSSDGGSSGSTTTTAPVDNTTTDIAQPVVETTFSTQQGQPFSEPPVIAAEDGVLETSFDAATATFEVGGTEVKGMGYAGQLLGPTLLVAPGDTSRST